MEIIAGIIFVFAFIGFLLWAVPVYNVWVSKKSGEADLANARKAEQIAIVEANTRKQAATLNKDAEVIDAQAVAESIKIIGDQLQKNPSYNVWQWIKMMNDRKGDTIYVPTEANLPITEAMRMKL